MDYNKVNYLRFEKNHHQYYISAMKLVFIFAATESAVSELMMDDAMDAINAFHKQFVDWLITIISNHNNRKGS